VVKAKPTPLEAINLKLIARWDIYGAMVAYNMGHKYLT
jgi:hypothetical protein